MFKHMFSDKRFHYFTQDRSEAYRPVILSYIFRSFFINRGYKTSFQSFGIVPLARIMLRRKATGPAIMSANSSSMRGYISSGPHDLFTLNFNRCSLTISIYADVL